MTASRIIPYIIILILFGYILWDFPSDVVMHRVLIPEKKGEFEKPVTIIKYRKRDSIVYKEGDTVFTENPVNRDLAERFKKLQKEKDSLSTFKLYVDAIQEREQTQVFDNKDIKLEVYTKTRGTILEVKPKYIIKEREELVEVKTKQTVLAVYAGTEVKSTTSLEKVSLGASIGIQSKSGTIISAGIFTDKTIQVGIKFRILNIKK